MYIEAAAVTRRGVAWSITLGILMILVGGLAIVFPLAFTLAAEIFIGWILVLRGIFQSVDAIQQRKERGFALDLLVGVLSAVAGVLLLVYPLQGVLVLTLVLGIYLVLEGIIEASVALRVRPMRRWGWLLFDGILTFLIGMLIWLRWPSTAPWALGLLVGITILSSGITRLMVALVARDIVRRSSPARAAPPAAGAR